MNESRTKKFFRWLLALFFIFAGIAHFVKPESYLKIVPSYLPAPLLLVYVSGFFESLGGIGMLIPQTRRWAGWGLIALLVAVFPANIEMLRQNWQKEGLSLFTWVLIFRLPFQVVFVWAVWKLTNREKGVVF
ncbi:MAG: DoxX family protein [Verrucomicrobiota bacterium]